MGSYSYNLARLLAKCNQVVVFSGCAFINESISKEYEIINCGDLLTSVIVKCDNSDDFKIKVVSVFETLHKSINFDIIESPEVGACALNIKLRNPQIPLVVKLHTPVSLLGQVVVENAPLKLRLLWLLKYIISFGKQELSKFYIPLKETDNEYEITRVADALYSPSKALFHKLQLFWNLNSDCQYINNYYPLNFNVASQLSNKKRLTISNQIVITFIGKLTFLKGADVVFKIIPLLAHKAINFKINIIGNDNGDLFSNKYLDKYSNIINKNKNNIVINSRLPNTDILDVLNNTHVLLVPSLWENQPTVIFEAISKGCVVIANDVGGIAEIIDNKTNGFLISKNNKLELISIIHELIKNPDLFTVITQNAIKKCAVLFDKEIHISNQLSFYNSVIK